jgi:hypothetical protein
VIDGIPPLTEKDNVSPDLRDFASRCLEQKNTARASSQHLMRVRDAEFFFFSTLLLYFA